MKFYGGIAIAIVLLILLLSWLKESSESVPTTAAARPTPLATATPPAGSIAYLPPPIAAPRSTRIAADTIQYANHTPTPVAQPRASQACQALAGAAQKARVTVISCRDVGGMTVVTVSSTERNNIFDFLDEALRAGMRDIKPAQQLSQSIVQGRVVYQNTFNVSF